MKEHEPELYEDILKHVEGYDIFSSQHIGDLQCEQEKRRSVDGLQNSISKAAGALSPQIRADETAKLRHRVGEGIAEKIYCQANAA